MLTKICHLTSVHPIYDIRIFEKECTSLANMGYDVTLVGFGSSSYEEIKNGVKIKSLFLPVKNRLQRIFYHTRLIYKTALSLNADIYHIHDPELLPIALKLKRRGYKVIYDSHEDVPSQILSKTWIPKLLRKSVSFMYGEYEKLIFKRMDALISVTPSLTGRLSKLNSNTYEVTNFPMLIEGRKVERNWDRSICFAGGVTKQWLHDNIIKALEGVDVVYYLAGKANDGYLQGLSNLVTWDKVKYVGKIPHSQVGSFIANSSIGMALNQYSANVGYKLGSLGNTKLFEYMQIGIPVICTDFILWKQIIEKYNCGICVDPNNTDEIRQAIIYLLDNPDIAKKMGDNGRRAIASTYNWTNQEAVLSKLYKNVQNKN